MSYKLVERGVLNPLAEVEVKNLDLNPFPDDFEMVALVDNTKPGSDIILATLKKVLGHRLYIDVKKPAGAPATLNQLKRAASAELTILALADCGSCTSWVVLDAIRLEEMGVPTICIVSEHFTPFARELSSTYGLDDLRFLEIEHPIAGLSNDEVEEKTMKIIPTLKYLLQIP